MMNGEPIIGISCAVSEDGKQSYLKNKYYTSIREAGGIPVLIPVLDDDEFIGKIVGLIDGILLAGGPDVEPKYYGEVTSEYIKRFDAKRDLVEIKLVRTAFAHGKPMLGICRGVQVINVALGGSLHQDIYAFADAKFNHKQIEPRNCATHKVDVSDCSILRGIYKSAELNVNSFHHQTVKDIADNFIATAFSPDGLIEGIEHIGKVFIVGVQWHPEDMTADYPEHKLLFKAFVEKCRG